MRFDTINNETVLDMLNRNGVLYIIMVIEKLFNREVMTVDSLHSNNIVKETDHKTSIFSDSNEEKEKSFRLMYSQELMSKKQQVYGTYRGFNELEDERKKVRHQMMRTPGRRGEIIKDEEINKEISRRYNENQME
jgi:hypothetical protein